MKFYYHIVSVPLPYELLHKAKTFALAVAATTNYSDSNQTTAAKIINDHYVSKLGEEAVRLLFSRYAAVTEPDYAIYEAKEKSWGADLNVAGIPVAVKTQKRSSALRYSLSWTFQDGKLRKDPILARPEAWIVFTEFDDGAKDPVCYVYPPYQIKDLRFEAPVLPHLKEHKKVVYARSLLI